MDSTEKTQPKGRPPWGKKWVDGDWVEMTNEEKQDKYGYVERPPKRTSEKQKATSSASSAPSKSDFSISGDDIPADLRRALAMGPVTVTDMVWYAGNTAIAKRWPNYWFKPPKSQLEVTSIHHPALAVSEKDIAVMERLFNAWAKTLLWIPDTPLQAWLAMGVIVFGGACVTAFATKAAEDMPKEQREAMLNKLKDMMNAAQRTAAGGASGTVAADQEDNWSRRQSPNPNANPPPDVPQVTVDYYSGTERIREDDANKRVSDDTGTPSVGTGPVQ